MSKHTPGPLSCRYSLRDDGQWIAMQSNVPARDAGRDYLEYGEVDTVPVPNRIAAAAPEMLAALYGLLPYLENDDDVPAWTEACIAARAAIAKARGDA